LVAGLPFTAFDIATCSTAEMKAMRARLGKTLTLDTGAKPRGNQVASETMLQRKEIREMTEAEFAKLYKVKGEVMESSNSGMTVIYATRLCDGMQVVIKVRERSKSFSKDSDERDWRSTTVVQLNMPVVDTICQFIDVIATKTNYYVVMEKVSGHDLFETMRREKMTQQSVREIIFQILEALKSFHAEGRIHKDLKLENVMVDMQSIKEPGSPGALASRRRSSESNLEPMTAPAGVRKTWTEIANKSPTASGGTSSTRANSPEVKLIDFDTVVDWEPRSPKARDILGTDGYIAPEAYEGDYSPASDVFCVGVIMYKLLTRKLPYGLNLFDDRPGENYVGSPAMKRIQDRLLTEPVNFDRSPFDSSPAARDLCRKMLSVECLARPSAEEALNHEWFILLPEDLGRNEKTSSVIAPCTSSPSLVAAG